MNSYEIGRDGQELKQRLERLEGKLSTQSTDFTPFKLATFKQTLELTSITLGTVAVWSLLLEFRWL